MPELPEVETIRTQLKKEIVGETVETVWFNRPKMLRPSAGDFKENVEGKKITDVNRRAKLIIFELDKGRGGYITTHLKLSGRLFVRNQTDKPDDYVHITLKFKSKKELRFSEARLFGYMQYVKDRDEIKNIIDAYGPEPLDDLTAEKLFEIFQKTKLAVKLVLLDQKKISGIGNIYANDALYLARINPKTPANLLSKESVHKLFKAVEEVLREGLKYGGASDQWYRQIHGEEGKYQEHFKIYGKGGKKCPDCEGMIKRIEIGGRGTFLCPTCQK